MPIDWKQCANLGSLNSRAVWLEKFGPLRANDFVIAYVLAKQPAKTMREPLLY